MIELLPLSEQWITTRPDHALLGYWLRIAPFVEEHAIGNGLVMSWFDPFLTQAL